METVLPYINIMKHTWGTSVSELDTFLGKYPFGIRSYLGNDAFGFLSVWEKIHLGKYPTAFRPTVNYFFFRVKYSLGTYLSYRRKKGGPFFFKEEH